MSDTPSQDGPAIDIKTTFTPNPLSVSLPVGTPVTLHVELTLRNATLPFTFAIKNSFLHSKAGLSQFRAFNRSKKEPAYGHYRQIMALVVGLAFDPDVDLLTLHPDCPTNYDFVSEVYMYTTSDGVESPFILGSRISSMPPGDTFEWLQGFDAGSVSMRSIWWCHWGTIDDAKRDRLTLNHNGHAVVQDFPTIGGYPQLRMVDNGHFTIVE
ncbi:MAG: hypothetical protein M1828_000518 [Chrysothrix sp. TS-e1954]|nr:MAG: hypothetical protein M1828_000518 [Chrysothrix sp. TS-e1954]